MSKSLHLVVFSMVNLVAIIALSGLASADHVRCGQTLFSDTVLDSDLECPSSGISMSNNIVLDCDGHSIRGPGGAVGISFFIDYNSEVRNCNIEDFASGIKFDNSGGNLIENNTISGTTQFGINFEEDSSLNQIIDNEIRDFEGVGIYVSQFSENNLISANDVHNSTGLGGGYCMSLFWAENNQVIRNSFSRCGSGLRFSTDNVLVKDNIASENTGTGFVTTVQTAESSTFINNTALRNDVGFFINGFDHLLINNTAIENRKQGYLVNGDNVTFDGNFAGKNSRGFVWRSPSEINTILNNEARNNGAGFSIKSLFWNPPFHHLEDNLAEDNNIGFTLESSKFNTIINNTALDNIRGFGFSDNSSFNIFSGNILQGNQKGLVITDSGENEITGAVFVNNSKGLILEQGSFLNHVYNNIFDNDINARAAGNNLWNTTLECDEENIVGGPCIGGNFWSDYQGVDLNGDAIGDTKLPYDRGILTGGDYLPLVQLSAGKPL